MYRLSDSLPYLLARLGVRMGDLFDQIARREGLTLAMYRVIAALDEHGRPLRLGELAAATSADLSTLSRLVGAMHRKGILLRERPENDQRSLQVTLTARGQALAARFMPLAAHYERVALGDLRVADAKALKATLATLYDNLDRLSEQIGSGLIEQIIPVAGRRAPAPARKQSLSRR